MASTQKDEIDAAPDPDEDDLDDLDGTSHHSKRTFQPQVY